MSKRLENLFLGASRGFGAAVLQQFLNHGEVVRLISRNPQSFKHNVESHQIDFTKADDQEKLKKIIVNSCPQRVFYFAGGGPFGEFGKQNLKSHLWATELNFIFPMKLLHFLMELNYIEQIIFIGSAIAESKADPKASSYCASKHGLLGLLKSIHEEKSTDKDIRLFSPGYMDTEMLPQGASVRSQEGKVLRLEPLAKSFYDWTKTEQAQWHFSIEAE